MTAQEFRAARERLHMTQQQMADAIGVHRGTIADWERGATPIPRMAALAVAHLSCR